ncbi:MAG: amidohydrolase family protein, partial [Planctomycetes bacterium]|nr:amidohydrolase family protein [Planctomycetota bacterium]
ELARRMNTEAAKAIRYGGLAPEVALRFVTKYPAIQLGIDDHVGSLEVGKDGDFVIWSGDPLSTTTRCEQTWIDGRRYFDLEDDARLRSMVEDERARLVSAILLDAANSQSADKDKGAGK